MMAIIGFMATGALAGCGPKVDTTLPESNARQQSTEGTIKPKTAAEQKKAIDDLIAKRDAVK